MKLTRKIQFAAVAVFIAGTALMTPLTYYYFHSKLVDAAPLAPIAIAPKPVGKPATATTPAVPVFSGSPVELIIPSLHFDLQVVDGYYNPKTGGWNVSNTQAQFATPSTEPNNISGNTLLYGHYRPEVFAYLHLIKPGATATIKTDNGYSFTYTYTNTQAYDPSDTTIFSYSGAPRLTIQTCSGTFMQNRQMFYFAYNSYTKN